jgi:hypothetical protein
MNLMPLAPPLAPHPATLNCFAIVSLFTFC